MTEGETFWKAVRSYRNGEKGKRDAPLATIITLALYATSDLVRRRAGDWLQANAAGCVAYYPLLNVMTVKDRA